jgi:hypothetical protein
VDKRQFNLFTFVCDKDQEIDEIFLDDNEIQCVYLLEPKENNDPKSYLKGISSITTKYEKFNKQQQTRFSAADYTPSDSVLTGIFFQKTARSIARRIVTKTVLNSNCNICVVGVHCIVSICRLVRETRLQLPDEVNLKFNVIDISPARLTMLAELVNLYLTNNRSFELVCIPYNFLLIPNECLQEQHVIMTFLHNSIDRLFAVKFTLLQCYFAPRETNKLQLLWFTKRLKNYANAAFVLFHGEDRDYINISIHTEVRTSRPNSNQGEG